MLVIGIDQGYAVNVFVRLGVLRFVYSRGSLECGKESISGNSTSTTASRCVCSVLCVIFIFPIFLRKHYCLIARRLPCWVYMANLVLFNYGLW